MEGQFADIIRAKIIDSQTKPLASTTRRNIHLPQIADKALAIIGMRRAGKTTYLWQTLAERVKKGMPREGALYFSFEDERLEGFTTTHLQLIVEEFYRLAPDWRDNQRALFMLDEIQMVTGWETFVRRLLDTEKIELFLSGSSAKLLSREIATSMRGRAMEVVVLPFSFREYLRHKNEEPLGSLHRISKALRSQLQKHLAEYLVIGGFPEAQGAVLRDRVELLRGYVDVVLLRDIIERHAVSHPTALRWMVRHLLGNAAGSFSINKFHGDLKSQGIPIGKDTLHEYLAHIEDAFLIRTLNLAADSERRRMVNPRKVYPIDTGLIPVFDKSSRSNVGHALETCVLLELMRRGADISYVHTHNGFEVDFLARYPDGRQELIQVCTDLSDLHTRQREIRALEDASSEQSQATLHLITLAPETALKVPKGITVHDAALWLLDFN